MRAVVALKAIYPVKVLLQVANLASSTYYAHLAQQDRPDPYAELRERLVVHFQDAHQRYGHRRLHACVQAEGHVVAKKTVLKLIREEQLVCRVRRKRRSRTVGALAKAAPNRLARDYRVTAPNQKWVTDITEFHVQKQRLYLTTIMDVCGRQILAYDVGRSPSVRWVNEVLGQALATLQPNEAPLVHSDQGFQYRNPAWLQRLEHAGARASMSRAGTCLDNALMENFFSHLKAEMFLQETFETIEALETAIHAYIDWYNTRRLSSTLGYMSPVHYRAQWVAI